MQRLPVRSRLSGGAAVTRVVLRGSAARSPFFRIGDDWFMDLGFNWGHPLAVDVTSLVTLLRSDETKVVIARRLTAAEAKAVLSDRRDSEEQTLARLIPNDRARWQVRRRRHKR